MCWAEMDGVISVFRSQPSRLHTTRSWDFISLLEANWDASMANGEELLKKAGYGQNVTVGVIDTGIRFFFICTLRKKTSSKDIKLIT